MTQKKTNTIFFTYMWNLKENKFNLIGKDIRLVVTWGKHAGGEMRKVISKYKFQL